MITRFSVSSIVLAAGAALALTASAHAQDLQGQEPGPMSLTVSYGDLDLTHDAGAQALYHRIRHAAERVCGGYPDSQVLALRSPYETCRKEAVERAVKSLHAPMVTAAAGVKTPAIVVASR